MNPNKDILLELHYLPSIQYFSKLVQHPCVFIEQCENYHKGGYRNRAYIAGANGKTRLSIPLQKGKNQQQSIREVRISYQESWYAAHWVAIRSAYGNSPYFEHYADEIKACYDAKPEFLFDFNLLLLKTLIGLIGIDVRLAFNTTYQAEPQGILDFRNRIHPKDPLGNMDDHFHIHPYSQVFQEKIGYLPNLSVIDLLFCTGPQSIQLLEHTLRT